MSIISVRIQGVTPLLMNRFSEEAELQVSSGRSKVGVGKQATPREAAAKKAYTLPDGTLYIPGPNIFSCMIQAGKFHKVGKSKLTTTRSSLLPAGVTLQEIACPLDTKDFEVDSRSVVIPATGGRVMAHRPRLDKWSVAFTLEVDDSMFDASLIREVLDDAGSKVGLGDFRPDRKGPFGRFKVVEWVEKDA